MCEHTRKGDNVQYYSVNTLNITLHERDFSNIVQTHLSEKFNSDLCPFLSCVNILLEEPWNRFQVFEIMFGFVYFSFLKNSVHVRFSVKRDIFYSQINYIFIGNANFFKLNNSYFMYFHNERTTLEQAQYPCNSLIFPNGHMQKRNQNNTSMPLEWKHMIIT